MKTKGEELRLETNWVEIFWQWERRWGDESWKAVVVRWRDRREEDWEVAACASALFKLPGSLLLLRAGNSLQILLSWVAWDRLLWNSVCQISHRRTDTDAPFFFRRDNWHDSISVPMSRFTWLRESLMIPTKRPQKSQHRAGGNRPRKSRIEVFQMNPLGYTWYLLNACMFFTLTQNRRKRHNFYFWSLFWSRAERPVFIKEQILSVF